MGWDGTGRDGTGWDPLKRWNGLGQDRNPLSSCNTTWLPHDTHDHNALLHDSCHLCQQASPNHLSKTAAVALRETLSSLRGGESGSSDQVSVLTLFVRVFVPSFQRQSEANQEGLDLEGGGLMRRIARLVSGILHKVPRFPRRANANGESA